MKPEQMLVGDSDAVVKLRREVQKVGARKDNVLIEGERGSGRTTVARILHGLSAARGELVELVPLGASDQSTGDALTRAGTGATLLVCDVCEFPYLHQAMTAAFIRAAVAKRGPRIIVTVTGDFEEAAGSGRIHPELAAAAAKFARIAVPPLSRRVPDIPLLAAAFVQAAAAATGGKPRVIRPATEDFLKRRTWKGNVRELKAVIERAAMESGGEELELPTDLVDEAAQLRGIISNIGDRRRFSFDKSLSNLEKTLIERALREVSANQSHAAEILNLSEANLRYRMKKFRIRTGA